MTRNRAQVTWMRSAAFHLIAFDKNKWKLICMWTESIALIFFIIVQNDSDFTKEFQSMNTRFVLIVCNQVNLSFSFMYSFVNRNKKNLFSFLVAFTSVILLSVVMLCFVKYFNIVVKLS